MTTEKNYWRPTDAMESDPFPEFSEEPTVTDPLRTLTALELCSVLGWPSKESEP